MDFGAECMAYWQAFYEWLVIFWNHSLPTLRVIAWYVFMWCLVGMPFGIWNSVKLRRKFEAGDTWKIKLAGYLGLAIVFSLGGLFGTGYLIYRLVRWPIDRVRRTSRR